MKKQSTFPIEDETSLKQWIEKSDNMLLIIDIHLNWTGSCEVLTPSFDQLYIQYENAEERFAFLSMEGPRYADLFESLVSFSAGCIMSLDDVVPMNGSAKDHGDSSKDDAERMKLLLTKKGKGCSPLFLAVKGRKIVSIVEGANYPALAKILEGQVPPFSDEDKIEDPAD